MYRTCLAVHGAFDGVGTDTPKVGTVITDAAPLIGVKATVALATCVIRVDDNTPVGVGEDEDAAGETSSWKISFCAPSTHPHFWL